MDLEELFGKEPYIIGMIHCAGASTQESVDRALEEIAIYKDAGLSGAIVENYHSSTEILEAVLAAAKTTLPIGINVLPNEYSKAFALAEQYSTKFIQLDHVAGAYYRDGKNRLPSSSPLSIDKENYHALREAHKNILVLGGVWPKYYQPAPQSNLITDIANGMNNADAVVVTGSGTGRETPIEKIKEFRKIMNIYKSENFPLVIGSGLNSKNVKIQLAHAQGAIVGSAFKPQGDTILPVDRNLVYGFMDVVSKMPSRRN